MAARRRIAVLVVAEHRDIRALYVETLLSAGFMVHGAAALHDAEPVSRTTRFDIVVMDSILHPAGLEVAERFAALRPRPRLVIVTSRPRNGAPLEWLFDLYLDKPCPPDVLVEALRQLPPPVATPQDLLIVSRDRVGIHDVLERFGESMGRLEVRLDRRRGQRRRARASAPGRDRRRQQDRRSIDVDSQLRMNGWAFIPAAARG